MANERIFTRGTTKTLQSGGAAVSNNAISAAASSTYGTTADGSDYPDGEFVLSVTSGSNLTENTIIELIARPIDIDGTTDAPVPTATYRERRVGFFTVKAATQNDLLCVARDLPKLAEYYIYLNGTGAITAWTLKVTPRTEKAA